MVTALDVAAYILQKTGRITTMKLQKLVYYAQAWSLVWDERPLFPERVEAWASGPVVRELYERHRGQLDIDEMVEGNPEALDDTQKETVEAVLEHYGGMSAYELSGLTHREDPWKRAREGVPQGARSDAEILRAWMHEYYSGITEDADEEG